MGRQFLRWAPFLVVAATVLYTLSVYSALPERMPTHWGINGQPNGWSSREIGAWLLPAMMAFLAILFRVLPKIDPKKANYDKFGIAYDVTAVTAITFQAVVQWAVLNIAQGHSVDLNTIVYVGLGAMFTILGFALPAARQNWFFGIRTPWTMSDEGVWERTHKTSGLLLVGAGIITIAAALTGSPMEKFVTMLVATLTAGAGSVLLSYLYWRTR
jgi:uncharacterized membrane protein